MKLQRIPWVGGQLYLWPDQPGQMIAEKALAGPFETATAARWALLDVVEQRFKTDAQRELWAKACWQIKGGAVDVAQMLGVAGLILRDRPEAFVMACARPQLRRVEQVELVIEPRTDIKMLAAGEGSDR